MEDVVTNVIDLYNWRIALAEFGVEHALEAGRCRDEDELVGEEDPPFHSELHITQFGIVDELGVDAWAAVEGRVSNLFDQLTSITRGEDVSQQQRGTFILNIELIICYCNWFR